MTDPQAAPTAEDQAFVETLRIMADVAPHLGIELRHRIHAAASRFEQLAHLAASIPIQEASPEADEPSARLVVDGGAILGGFLYSPGLPDGDHDVWCGPVRAALPQPAVAADEVIRLRERCDFLQAMCSDAQRIAVALQARAQEPAPVAWHVDHQGSAQIYTRADAFDATDCAVTPLYTSPQEAHKVECSGVPEGWKLVPIRTNWDMRNEGREILIDTGESKEYEATAAAVWNAMLSAAPSPSQPDVQAGEAG